MHVCTRKLASYALTALSMFAAIGCKENRPAGGLVIHVQSDLGLPHDVDMFRLDVTQDGEALMRVERDLSDQLAVPVQFKLPPPRSQGAVTLRAVGYKDRVARVERTAITPVPRNRLGVLRMSLSYLCLDRAACAEGLTCKAGQCVDPNLPLAELPTYDPSQFGPETAGGSKGECFDVLKCFGAASTLELDAGTCSAELQTGAPERANLALRFDSAAGTGVCDSDACWLALDPGEEGFRVQGDRVQLPAALCQRSGAARWRLALSETCEARKPGQRSCAGSPPKSTLPAPAGDVLAEGRVTLSNQLVPAVGPACEPPGAEACAMCGTRSRTCTGGVWSEWSECTSTGVCMPNERVACEEGGSKVCGSNCQWGPCEGPCDGPDTEACARCGTRHRTCNAGKWSAWSECAGGGVCEPNDLRECGVDGMQRCGGSCQWGPCGNAVCVGAPTQACDRCGTQQRSCDALTETWSDWGACEQTGPCSPGETLDCGNQGKRSCGGDCQWDSVCRNQVCEGPSVQGCGLCGTSTRSCDGTTGLWSAWSECSGEGECMATDTRSCAQSSTQVCGGDCRWGECTDRQCPGESSERCGNCGTRTRVCNRTTGTWSEWSSCMAQGECAPADAPRACAGGQQLCGNDCRWSACTPLECGNVPFAQACGLCGSQTRSCDASTGLPTAWSACSGQGVCQPDTTQSCGSGGQQTCGANCQWGAQCSNQQCDVPALRACGNCGTQFSSCDPNTGIASWSSCMDQGECRSTATQPCGGTGTQRCDASCGWGACECGSGFGLCQGTCLDLRSDGNNCGACGARCGAGTRCAGGTCVSVCSSEQTWCGACTDLQSDSANCGACGAKCAPGTRCSGGSCSAICTGSQETFCDPDCADLQSDDNHCGDCSTRCAAGAHCSSGKCITCARSETFCAPSCVDLQSDETHCGTCSTACRQGATCVRGSCVTCPTGQRLCGDTCVDVLRDGQNCGSCGNVCSPGVACSGGVCGACSDPAQIMCSGVCRSVQSDNNHCGACGVVCPSGTQCRNASCVCIASGLDLCDQSCVDTQLDRANCGECGNVCPAALGCSAGTCSVCTNTKLSSCTSGGVTACVDTSSDRNNCGACGEPCPAGVSCIGGQCGACSSSALTFCPNSGCVDTSKDTKNCGTCGNACPDGIPCDNSTCAICRDTSQTFCSGIGCVDLRSDPQNCLRCGNRCPAPDPATGAARCSANGCYVVCKEPNTFCQDTNKCVDINSDASNCGACGKACGRLQRCTKGQCVNTVITVPIAGTGGIRPVP